MPESQEVKIIAEQLGKELKNAKIINIIGLNSGRYKNTKFDLEYPIKVKGVNKKGKFIYFVLDGGNYLFNTLGLSGHWSKVKLQNASIEIIYKRNSVKHTLYFIDQLHYGTLKISRDLERKLATIGADVDLISKDEFIKILSSYPDREIGSVLMNQKIISGIGAYLRSEILYLAGVNPFKKIKFISVDILERIYKAMRLILKLAYKCNGTSIEFYKDINNHEGKYDKYLMVYGKEKDAEGNEIKKGLLDKRNIYWVPRIQL